MWPEGPADYATAVVPGLSRDSARVLMPNFERVRQEGAVFTQAYTPTPLCAPARFAVLTGRHCSESVFARTRENVHVRGKQDIVYVNNDACQLTPSAPQGGNGRHDVTLPKLLADAGYTTIFSGWASRSHRDLLARTFVTWHRTSWLFGTPVPSMHRDRCSSCNNDPRQVAPRCAEYSFWGGTLCKGCPSSSRRRIHTRPSRVCDELVQHTKPFAQPGVVCCRGECSGDGCS